MSMAMSLQVDDAQVRSMLARAPAEIRRRTGQLVEGAAIDVQREMRIKVNVGATGDLRKSIRYSYSPALLQAKVKANADYADRVELGGPPVYLSVQPGRPLRKWADFKGINPYAVRNSIAKKGTKEHPFVKPTYDKMKPQVERDITSGISNLVDELNR